MISPESQKEMRLKNWLCLTFRSEALVLAMFAQRYFADNGIDIKVKKAMTSSFVKARWISIPFSYYMSTCASTDQNAEVTAGT